MIHLIGWVGSICFSICALPQTIRCYKQGHAHGLDTSFLLLWLLGEICLLIYTVYEAFHLPLIVNYVFSLLSLLVILKYRFFPRINKEKK
jgi:uncharacterized protein with PQ loop repeat